MHRTLVRKMKYAEKRRQRYKYWLMGGRSRAEIGRGEHVSRERARQIASELKRFTPEEKRIMYLNLRMKKAMKNYGLPEPVFEIDKNWFTIIFKRPSPQKLPRNYPENPCCNKIKSIYYSQ